jgi:hypothetical protein
MKETVEVLVEVATSGTGSARYPMFPKMKQVPGPEDMAYLRC